MRFPLLLFILELVFQSLIVIGYVNTPLRKSVPIDPKPELCHWDTKLTSRDRDGRNLCQWSFEENSSRVKLSSSLSTLTYLLLFCLSSTSFFALDRIAIDWNGCFFFPILEANEEDGREKTIFFFEKKRRKKYIYMVEWFEIKRWQRPTSVAGCLVCLILSKSQCPYSDVLQYLTVKKVYLSVDFRMTPSIYLKFLACDLSGIFSEIQYNLVSYFCNRQQRFKVLLTVIFLTPVF